jgi:hypothetical protein
MKTLAALLLILVITCLSACHDLTANGKGVDSIRLVTDDKSAANMDSASAIKAWTDFKTPGAMHRLLAKANGQWKESISTWQSPSAQPQKTASTCVNTMILGGRYQQSVHKGTIMGMPFEGISTIGYDNVRKEFVSTWIDNMGTGFMEMAGTFDSIANVIHFKGTTTDPISGRTSDVREDFKFLTNDTQLLEMFAPQMAGKPEFKVMEIKLTRSR